MDSGHRISHVSRLGVLVAALPLLLLAAAPLATAMAVAPSARPTYLPTVGVATGARATTLPHLLLTSESTAFGVRPKTVSPDPGGMRVLDGLKWRSWSNSGARGSGTFRELNFSPALHHAVTVRASAVRHGRFTRLLVRFRSGRTVKYPLLRDPNSGLYSWVRVW